MNKLKLASGVLLVFLVGVLAGSLGTGYYYKERVKKFEEGGPPVQERIQIILGRFSNELELTNEQRVEIEKIIKESQEKKISLSKKMEPDIKQINDDTFTSIKKKLTDEQKTKLEELMTRMDNVRERFPSGPRQQQRNPDQTRPQQGGPNQGHQQQGAPDQIPPQAVPGQAPQGTPGENPLTLAPGPSQMDYMRIAGDLKNLLTLSQDQEGKLRTLLDKFSKNQQAVFDKYTQEKHDSNVVKNALLEAEKSFEKDLSNLLTKEQMENYRKAKDSGAVKLSPPDMP